MADTTGPPSGRPDGTQARRRRVTVAGAGMLAAALDDWLSSHPGIDLLRADSAGIAGLRDLPQDDQVLITASDGWDCRDYGQVQALCSARGVSWLPIRTEPGRVVIGPLHTPGVPGCVRCAELRRSLADEHYAERASILRKYPQLASQPSPWLTSISTRTVAAVAAEEAILPGQPRPGRAACSLLYVELGTLAVSAHRFLPDPLCPACGTAPEDTQEAARITLQPRPKSSPGADRVRVLGGPDAEMLRETYIDEETGLIRRVQAFASGSLAVAAAEMRAPELAGTEVSWGRTHRYRTSEIVAVLEALERYGGIAQRGRRPAVRASYTQIQASALDPRTLGLHPPGWYARPDARCQAFDADRACWWVWGYSFARREPIMVPRSYAYYGANRPDDPPFCYETSNGCALGSCLEEAILHGILEAAERDAFLMTWYARLPAARIDLSSARDRSVPVLAEAISADTGYQVLVFDTTMEHGIPSVWAMAVRGRSAGQPALACAAGAHLDPEMAVSRALCELGPVLAGLIRRYPAAAERARAMAGDPALVATMDDHSVLYTSHEAGSRLDFLTMGTHPRGFTDIRRRYGGDDALRSCDLTDDLTDVIGRLAGHGLDVIVVDQTAPEHCAGGFCCVKVIVPGMLPMTFGHGNQRIYGLPRLLEVPRILGYRDRALQAEEINPHPHPFP